jgi:transposase
MIKTISEQIESIACQIDTLIKENPLLTARKKLLKSVLGIGDIVANELLILLSELESLIVNK